MNPDKAIDLLEEDLDPYQQCPALLEAGTVDSFLAWLNDHVEYLEHLEQKRWRIGVLRHQLESRADWPKLERNLLDAGIEVQDDDLTSADERLVTEMLYAYFGGVGTHRKAAHLLAYGRKHTEDSVDIQIISRLSYFRMIPNVQLYFIPGIPDRGSEDDATFLRALDLLRLHPQVRRAAYERIVNRDNAIAVDQAVKMLIDEIRHIGVDHNLPFATDVNDRPMVDKAFRTSVPSGNQVACNPAIQLNDYGTSSEHNEQQGYHDIIHGVVGAVRNPLAHGPVDLPFLQKRFGDRHTALKFLCLLSLLFEKLDKRVAPL